MTVSVQGTNGKWVEESRLFDMPFGHNHYIKLYYGADNLEIKEILFIPIGKTNYQKACNPL